MDNAFNNEFQRALFDQSPDGIMIDDGTGRLFDVNSTLCNWLGYEREELLKLHFKELIDKESLSYKPFAIKEGRNINLQQNMKRKDGSLLAVELSSRSLPNGHSLVYIHDITRRQKAELELHELERTYSTLLSNLPGFVFRCKNDRDRTMEYISEGCFAVTGYYPEDLINNKVLSFNDIVHPDYKENIWNEWQESLKRKETFENEYPIINAGKEIRWVWEKGKGIFTEKGELQFLEGFITDITESKNSATKLQMEHDNLVAIMAASPIGLLVIDENRKIIEANPEASRLFNKNLEELKHRFCGDFLGCVNRYNDVKGCGHTPQCKACKLMLAIDEVMMKNTGIHDEEIDTLLDSNNGKKQYWLTFSMEPVLLHEQRHIVLALYDITERKISEEKVKELNAELDLRVIERTDQLQEANKEMEAFAYSIAHDLRAPLRAIDGYTQIIREDYETKFDDEGKRILSIIRGSAQKI